MQPLAPGISKKRRAASQQTRKHAVDGPSSSEISDKPAASPDVEFSPVSVKQKVRSRDDHASIPEASCSARRRLNLSSLDISSIATSTQQAFSIGALTRMAPSALNSRDSGRCEVSVHASVIRVPSTWEKFQFFLLMDHTGVVSLGASVEKFDVIKPFLEDKTFPPLHITGFVYYKWSTKNKGELYVTLRDNDSKVEVESSMENLQTFSAFHTIRNIISNPYYTSVTFTKLIGDFILVQSEQSEVSFMLQDSTGLALIHVLNWSTEKTNISQGSSSVARGANVIEGLFKFQIADIDGVAAIATSVDYNDVKIKKIRDTILTTHIKPVKNTPKNDYLFTFDDSAYDTRNIT